MRHTEPVAGHRIIDLERALAAIRTAGATDDTELRIKVTWTAQPAGGLPKSITGHWSEGDITPAPSPSARPLHGGPWGRPATGPVDK